MDAMRDEQSGAATDQPFPATPDQTAHGVDVFSVIADVEQHLGQLRKLHAEREQARAQHQEREAALAKREEAIRAEAEAVRREQESLAAAQEEMRQKSEALSRAAAEFEQRRSELSQGEASLAEERREFEERSRAAAAELDQRRSELEARAASLAEREQRVQEESAKLLAERAALEAMTEDLAVRERELGRRAGEVEAKLEQERAEFTARLEEAVRAAESEAARGKAAADLAAEAQRRAEQLADEVACWRRTAEELEAQAGKQAEQLQAEAAQSRRACEELRAGLEAAVREREALQAKLEESAREQSGTGEKLAELERELAGRDAKIQDLTKKLSAATAKLKEVCQALEHQGMAVQQAQAAADELRQRDESIAALRAEIEGLRRQLQEAEALRQSPEREGGETRRRLELAEAELGRLGAKLQEARAEAESLREQLQEASMGGGPAGRGVYGDTRYTDALVEALDRRHRRLQAMHALLRERAKKVRAAGEALGARKSQVDQVLAQRAELAAARKAMADSQRRLEKMQRGAARGRVMAVLFYGVALLGLLAGLSWLLTSHLAPATYAARATIRAESGGRPLSEAQLEEWQRFHESLLLDPQVLQEAAERMSRRGIASLGTPGALLERLQRDMAHLSAGAGTLTLELRGRGEDRTVRELDTYLTALVSYASATAGRRADGVATFISEPPNAGSGPVEDHRPVYALVFFGGGVGASAVCGVLLWRRMSQAKARFEEEAHIDAILNAANWDEAAPA